MILRRFHWLPLLLLAVGFAASLLTLSFRYRAEARSRAVGLVLDNAQLRELAASAGVPPDRAYAAFRSAGIRGVAVAEETIADLQASGLLEIRASGGPGGRSYRFEFRDPEVAARAAAHLERYLPAAAPGPAGQRLVIPVPGGGAIERPGRPEEARPLTIGLDPAEVAAIRAAGLEPVGRIENTLGLTRDSLRWKLGRLRDLGIRTVVFGGEEVLGYRGLIPETAAAFRDLGLVYGSVEFGKQRGDASLSSQLLDRMIRVHSISTTEMLRLPASEAVERYVRAAAERNIRLNYVRLPGVVTARTFDDSVAYVRSLSRALAAAGFGLGTPVPFGGPAAGETRPIALRAVTALGVGAAAVLLLAGLAPIGRSLQALLAAVAGITCAAAAASGVTLGVQAVALLAACVFPVLAFVLFPQPLGAFAGGDAPAGARAGSEVVPAVAGFAAISAVTLAGALMAAGLLSELSFMLKVQSFAGIKAATVLPILAVAGIYLTGVSGEYRSWAEERQAVRRRLDAFLARPLLIWHAAAVAAALAALVLLVLRSGNDPGVGVSDLELRMRSVLDRALGVRPRTKEFAVGHPALLLGLAMAARPAWRGWALPLVLAGIIGQVGLFNSFCHLHTPLRLTLLRTFHGLWLGALIGLVLVWIWGRLRGKGASPGERHPA